MPKNKLKKSLHDYLSKIKKQTPNLQFSNSLLSSTTSKILSGCKYPKSFSFNANRKGSKKNQQRCNDDPAATLEDIDRFLHENFKSWCVEDDNNLGGNNKEKQKGNTRTNKDLGIPFDSPRFFTPPPDLCGSHRFFVSPVPSSSLLEGARMSGVGTTSTSTSTSEDARSISKSARDNSQDCVALLKVSTSPYQDFRRSMQQVLEARINNNQKVDWDFLEEILFSYLRLNENKQYRYILSAFADLIVVLRQNELR